MRYEKMIVWSLDEATNQSLWLEFIAASTYSSVSVSECRCRLGYISNREPFSDLKQSNYDCSISLLAFFSSGSLSLPLSSLLGMEEEGSDECTAFPAYLNAFSIKNRFYRERCECMKRNIYHSLYSITIYAR